MARILVLESNSILAEQYGQIFSMSGHAVDVCRDAQTAIIAADKNTPDIVVLELLLSSHSGIEFLYEFRSYSEWRSIPVLVASRVPKTELNISDKTINELGIKGFIYIADSSLKRLNDKVSQLLDQHILNGV